MEPRNQFQRRNSDSLCNLAGPYDNPIPTPQTLAPIDCLKIPALDSGLPLINLRQVIHHGTHPLQTELYPGRYQASQQGFYTQLICPIASIVLGIFTRHYLHSSLHVRTAYYSTLWPLARLVNVISVQGHQSSATAQGWLISNSPTSMQKVPMSR